MVREVKHEVRIRRSRTWLSEMKSASRPRLAKACFSPTSATDPTWHLQGSHPGVQRVLRFGCRGLPQKVRRQVRRQSVACWGGTPTQRGVLLAPHGRDAKSARLAARRSLIPGASQAMRAALATLWQSWFSMGLRALPLKQPLQRRLPASHLRMSEMPVGADRTYCMTFPAPQSGPAALQPAKCIRQVLSNSRRHLLVHVKHPYRKQPAQAELVCLERQKRQTLQRAKLLQVGMLSVAALDPKNLLMHTWIQTRTHRRSVALLQEHG